MVDAAGSERRWALDVGRGRERRDDRKVIVRCVERALNVTDLDPGAVASRQEPRICGSESSRKGRAQVTLVRGEISGG